MARGINQATLIGNLGADPELRQTNNGNPVCNFRLATSDTYTNKAGEKVESTQWHTIVAWGRLAEICGEYLQKGSKVYIQGSIEYREWTDDDGGTRYVTEIIARDMQMLDSKGSRNEDPSFDPGERAPARKPAKGKVSKPDAVLEEMFGPE